MSWSGSRRASDAASVILRAPPLCVWGSGVDPCWLTYAGHYRAGGHPSRGVGEGQHDRVWLFLWLVTSFRIVHPAHGIPHLARNPSLLLGALTQPVESDGCSCRSFPNLDPASAPVSSPEPGRPPAAVLAARSPGPRLPRSKVRCGTAMPGDTSSDAPLPYRAAGRMSSRLRDSLSWPPAGDFRGRTRRGRK